MEPVDMEDLIDVCDAFFGIVSLNSRGNENDTSTTNKLIVEQRGNNKSCLSFFKIFHEEFNNCQLRENFPAISNS